jgi:hypothetical protein
MFGVSVVIAVVMVRLIAQDQRHANKIPAGPDHIPDSTHGSPIHTDHNLQLCEVLVAKRPNFCSSKRPVRQRKRKWGSGGTAAKSSGQVAVRFGARIRPAPTLVSS